MIPTQTRRRRVQGTGTRTPITFQPPGHSKFKFQNAARWGFLGGFSCWVQHPYECSPTSIKIAVLPRGSLFDTHARQGRQLLIYKFLNKIRCVGRSVGGDPRTSWSFSPAPPAEIAACSRPSASAPTAANIFAPCAIKRWAV